MFKRMKLVIAAACILFPMTIIGQTNPSDQIITNENFSYQPTSTDMQGTWRTSGSGDTRIILSGVLNTNIEIGGLSAKDILKISGFSGSGFTIQRDAGTFSFEGYLSVSGKGSGRFYFRPDKGFADKMKYLQFAGLKENNDTSLYYYSVHNLSCDYAMKIKEAGYNGTSSADLLLLRSSGVTPEYIQVLIKIGYKNISSDDLILLSVQKVPTDFIKSVIGTSDNLPTIRELTLIWMYGDKAAKYKQKK